MEAAFTPRMLPRAGRGIPPVIWELGNGGFEPPAELNWCFVSAEPEAALPQDAKIVLGISGDQLGARRNDFVRRRLADLRHSRCEAIVIQQTTPGEIKAGTPFHRLACLRDEGLTDLFFVEAQDYAEAEWMLHHTPAHAIVIPFGIADQTAKYRLLEEARNFSTGIIARVISGGPWNTPVNSPENLRFVAGEQLIASMIVPAIQAAAAIDALRNAMEEDQRSALWTEFQKNVTEPALPTRNLPPEFG